LGNIKALINSSHRVLTSENQRYWRPTLAKEAMRKTAENRIGTCRGDKWETVKNLGLHLIKIEKLCRLVK